MSGGGGLFDLMAHKKMQVLEEQVRSVQLKEEIRCISSWEMSSGSSRVQHTPKHTKTVCPEDNAVAQLQAAELGTEMRCL